MLLPVEYHYVEEYFNDALHFFYEYRWVYCFPLTRLLVCDVLNFIPIEWRSILEDMSVDDLALLSSGTAKKLWPPSLKHFLMKCRQLQLGNNTYMKSLNLSPSLQKGLSPKKRHEVSQLAELVYEECKRYSINKILDVGSGMGYLDLVLHLEFGYNVLGLESNTSLVETASKRASQICKGCEGIAFKPYEVSNTVDAEIIKFLQNELFLKQFMCTCCQDDDKVKEKDQKDVDHDACLVGLHPCGDLSSACADLFLQLPQLKLMILVPCCYHKMETSDEMKDANVPSASASAFFPHFPLSQTLSCILREKFKGHEEYFDRPFLRLASQESSVRWQRWTEQQHKQRAENLMMRAVLELACRNYDVHLKKRRRRCVRKSQRDSFETFVEDVAERYDFIQSNGVEACAEVTEDIFKEMKSLWIQHNKSCSLAEAFSGLQAAMQACIESFVLVDKMEYMQEQHKQMGYIQNHELSFDVVKVMNEIVSPRCHALIVRKLKLTHLT